MTSDEDKKLKVFLKYYLVVFSLILGLVLWIKLTPHPLPVLGKVPPFHFKAEDGHLFDSKTLSGKVWVADFFYSACHASCPLQTAFMSGLQTEWKTRPDFNLVSFTLDPKDDTLPILAKYAKDSKADSSQWFFLRGDKTDTYLLAEKGFKVAAQVNAATGIADFIHTTRLILVDKNGDIRGYYDVLQSDETRKLESDLKHLL